MGSSKGYIVFNTWINILQVIEYGPLVSRGFLRVGKAYNF